LPRKRRLLGLVTMAAIAAGVILAVGRGNTWPVPPTLAAATTNEATATPATKPTRTPGLAATPAPLAKADTLERAGAPSLPIELSIPAGGVAWPVGLFALNAQPGASKAGTVVSFELGVLNEAAQPLRIVAAGQYKEAISLYSREHWLGLFFVGFQIGGREALPSGGGGAADLPPGVWGQVRLEAEPPQGQAVSGLRAGVARDRMTAYPLASISLKPDGQPWASPGAAPTPVKVTATPVATR
jgi:hypothetical protein